MTVGDSEEEYGSGGRGGGGGGEFEVAVHKLRHSQDPITLHTSLVSQTPSAPPTPKPLSRIHCNITPAYWTDDVELGGHGTLRVKWRERSISTPHDPIDLSTIYYTDIRGSWISLSLSLPFSLSLSLGGGGGEKHLHCIAHVPLHMRSGVMPRSFCLDDTQSHRTITWPHKQ